MATRQVKICAYTIGVNNLTQYMAVDMVTVTNNNVPIRVPYALKLKQLGISLAAAPGTGNSWTYEVLKNGSTCGMQIVISESGTTGLVEGNVSFGVDDTIILQRVPSSAPNTAITTVTWVWDMVQANQSAYLTQILNNPTTSLRSSPFGFRTATTGLHKGPVPIAGNLTKAKYNLSAIPGASKSISIAIYKNNVIQDGAGGTPDTRVVIADSATSGEWAGTLAVAQGDFIEVIPAPTNTPAAVEISCGFGFTQTTDGESVFSFTPSQINLPTTADTYFNKVNRTDSTAWTTTESAVETTIGGSGLSFALTKMYWGSNLSVGNNPVARLRKNQADAAPTLTMSGTSGNDTANSTTYVTGDEVDIRFTNSASPGATSAQFGIAMFATAQAGKGAGKGNRGGGGLNILSPSGANVINYGNPGLDISNLN